MPRCVPLLLTLLLPLSGQEESNTSSPPPDDGVRVTVLGYHDFSETERETEMRIRTSKFRAQMQALKDLDLSVIPMADFQAWKRGEKDIADKSIVITIDDGWKAVYTDAFPILKEFGYPFTLFLYKNYVDGGGKALTTAMIKEMMEHGATIGSHSVSHPLPGAVKTHRRKGSDAYDKFLRNELGESKRFLEAAFGERVTAYAYPGGFHTEEMFPLAAELGYEHLFTVLPGKIRRSNDDRTLPRYIILGTHDRIFDLATTFTEPVVSASGAAIPEAALARQTTPVPVQPEPGAVVADRMPLLTADLSGVADLDPKTLSMKVGGFGEVPAVFDEANKSFSWKINRRLRSPTCQVSITWRDTAGKPPETPLRWTFRIDTEAAYTPAD